MMKYAFSANHPVVVAVLVAALGGCGSTSDSPDKAQSTSSELARAKRAASAHGTARHVFDALGSVSLSADQRAELEKFARDAEPLFKASRDAHDALVEGVAAQVVEGAIDRKALQPRMDALAAALTKEQKGTREALIRFGLTADQRDAYGRAVRASIQAEDQVHRKDGSMRIIRALALTPEQKKLYQTAVLASAKPARTEPLSLTSAAPLVGMIDFLELTTPTLTVQQRAVAVASLRKTAPAATNEMP